MLTLTSQVLQRQEGDACEQDPVANQHQCRHPVPTASATQSKRQHTTKHKVTQNMPKTGSEKAHETLPGFVQSQTL
jgi:hypothetical protein